MQHWVRSILEDVLWSSKSMSIEIKNGVDRIIDLVEKNDVHSFRTAELEGLANDLAECVDLTDLSELMWQVATSVGFQHFTIFVLKQGTGGTFKSRVCTSYNEAWIMRYQEQSYQFIDPVMSQAAVSDGWFQFSDLKSDAPAIQSFWEDAEKHRIGKNGLCFAMTRVDGSRIGVSFSTMNTKEKVDQIVRMNGFDLRFLAHLAVDCFCFASFGPTLSDDTLNNEELRFLHILSSSSNPEDALKISSKYGSNKALQASIRTKLNVDSVFQAVAIAASKGWFNLLPYDPGEVLKPFPTLDGLGIGKSHADAPESDAGADIQVQRAAGPKITE